MLKYVLIIAILLFCTGALGQSRMSSAETSYLYDRDHEFLIDYRLARKDDQVKVYFRFSLNSGMVKVSDYEISYDLRNTYIDEKLIGSSIKLDTGHIIGTGFRERVYAFEFRRPDDQNLLVIQVENVLKARKYLVDIPVPPENDPESSPFLIFEADHEVPYFSKYLRKGDPIRIKNVFDGNGRYEITGKADNQSVAMPPFDDSEVSVPDQIMLDALYEVAENDTVAFEETGLYEIRAADNTGTLSLLVTDEFFPHFGEYRELIKPLIYISTNQEFTGMRETDEPREAFETFVTNVVSGNTQIAKDFIRYYYRRVRESAVLFTTTKEGWKTDRGMIFLIFGDPAQVFRNESSELWVYLTETGSRVRFVFDITNVSGGIREFRLIRGKKYRDGWMDAVTRWRSGRIIE